MFDDAATEDYHATPFCPQSTIIKQTNVLNEVNDKASLTPSVEVNDVSEGSISEGWAEDRNIVLPAPVINAVFVVDLLSDALDDLRGGEDGALFLLLFEHLLNQGEEPSLQECVVLVGHDKVTNAIKALITQLCTLQLK